MRLRPGVLPVLVALAASVAAGIAPSASAAPAPAPHCTYTPVLPKQIVVNRPTINFHTPVRIIGADCRRKFGASESLAHRTDTYFLNWTQDSHTASDAVYAVTVRPGTYRTAKDSTCTTYGPDGTTVTCAVTPGSTVIKFGGDAHLSGTRLSGAKKHEIRFTVRASRYASTPSASASVTTRVSIQRYYSRAWHTIHAGTARGKHGYAWTYTDSRAAQYRAVSKATGAAFAGVSRTVTR